jgi:hypothetical protein
VLRLSYQGSAGRHLFHASEINPALYGPGATIANTDRSRPMPEFTQLSFAGTYGVSNYDALVASVEKRFLHGSVTTAVNGSTLHGLRQCRIHGEQHKADPDRAANNDEWRHYFLAIFNIALSAENLIFFAP